MDLLRRDYGDDNQQYTTNLPSESTEFIKIHFSIIISVFLFIIIIGAILYMYRRKLKKIKLLTKNLNRSAQITHLTNTDEGIYNSLDYYTNNFVSSYDDSYDDNKSSTYPSDKIIISQLNPVHEKENENEPKLKKSFESPVSTISKGNRNYFVYAKSGKVKNDINSMIQSEKSDKKSISFSSIRRSKKKSTKVNFSQILSSITSPSDIIYDDEKPDTLDNTTTEILRGTRMTESHLIRQYSDTSDATITTVTSNATDFSDTTITVDTDNPILEMTKEAYFEMTKEGDLESTKDGDLEMTKRVDFNNKILITETKEVVLDMLPINENDNDSNLNYSYSDLSRESNIFNKYFYITS